MRLTGITTEFVGFIPKSLVLKSIVLGWILIHWNWPLFTNSNNNINNNNNYHFIVIVIRLPWVAPFVLCTTTEPMMITVMITTREATMICFVLQWESLTANGHVCLGVLYFVFFDFPAWGAWGLLSVSFPCNKACWPKQNELTLHCAAHTSKHSDNNCRGAWRKALSDFW